MTNLLKHPGTLTVGYVLLRMLLAPLSPVPAAVALDPLWIFALILRARAGRGWMMSLIPGLVFGDWMCGMFAGQIGMRQAGFLLLGLLPVRSGFTREYLSRMLLFALWSSLVPDWMGHFPLGYLWLVWFVQGILWWALAAAQGEEEGWCPPVSAWMIPLGLAILYLIFPLSIEGFPPALGTQSALGVRILAPLLLLPSFVPLWLQRRRSRGKSGGRWAHLAE
ncbi:MAG: hypothetical protein ACO3N7_05210 [Kiritimatiellia bacterium]